MDVAEATLERAAGEYRIDTRGLVHVVGYLDCALHSSHEAGDHVIVIGEVLALDFTHEVAPLLFHAGGYRFLKEG